MIITKYGRTFYVHRDGRIESAPHTDRRGATHRRRLLTHVVSAQGYPCVYTSIDGKRFGLLVHRLMAECFIPAVDGANQVNHKDGVKTNFALENLEWVTSKGNARHAIENGLTIPPASGPGELSRAAKLTAAEVAAIKRRLLNGEAYRKIAADYGVSAGTVGHIKYGKTWTEVLSA